MLEPYAGKLACTVLRGGGDREVIPLPAQSRGFDSHRPLQIFAQASFAKAGFFAFSALTMYKLKQNTVCKQHAAYNFRL